MSFPPYQQPPGGNQAPYPQQQYGDGMPPYPSNTGVFPPSLGFPTQAPMYMPQPGYPSFPPANYAYPPTAGYSPGGCYPPPPTASYAPGGCYPSSDNSSYGAPPPHSSAPPHGEASRQSSYSSYPNLDTANPTQTYNVPKYTPTVRPAEPFNPREDAEVLRKAMKGWGTDEKAIINVLTKRSNKQRLEIALQFKTLYGKDLIKDLKSETSGRFEDVLVALMTPLPQYYARELHDAMSGIGTDEDVLVEVMCTMTNNEIRTITTAYQQMYFRSLEEDLRGDTSGTFKRLMVSLSTAGRDESMHSNPAAATADAQSLLQAGELRLGTDESTFNMIMCQRNYAQLALIFNEYQRLTGHDIEKAIKNEFSGDSEDGMLAIIRSVRNRPGFFAKKIYESMVGMGTNDRQLIRIIVTRCEIDMVEIKTNYQAKYGKALKDAIADDTSGDYKKCLLALIGDY